MKAFKYVLLVLFVLSVFTGMILVVRQDSVRRWDAYYERRNQAVQQAYDEGRAAASQGIPVQACPYGTNKAHSAEGWKRGWIDATQSKGK
jgi:hypothetical protein